MSRYLQKYTILDTQADTAVKKKIIIIILEHQLLYLNILTLQKHNISGTWPSNNKKK